MKLIAQKSLIYSGKRIKAGEEFAAERRFGNLFIAIGKAKVAPPEPAVVAEPEEEPAFEAPEVIEEEPKPKPKRTYKRRDITAESNESEG